MKGRALARRLALCALLAVVATMLSYLEGLLPFPMPVPGLKLGFANVATLFALYHLSFKEAAAVVLVRCALSALLFGALAQLPFSLGGALCALLVMALSRRCPALSVFGVGIAGAAAHNAAQVSVAALLYGTPALFAYLAWLLPASILTGGAVALLYGVFGRAMRPIMRSAGLYPSRESHE